MPKLLGVDRLIDSALIQDGEVQPQDVATIGRVSMFRNFINGFNFSVQTGSATYTINPGSCVDSSHSDFITLSTSISKTIATSFAVGTSQGGLMGTALVSGDAYYYVWVIKNPTTGVVDVMHQSLPVTTGITSSTVPSLPSGFTLYRRIGAIRMRTGSVEELTSVDGTFFLPMRSLFSGNLPTATLGGAIGSGVLPLHEMELRGYITVYSPTNGAMAGVAVGNAQMGVATPSVVASNGGSILHGATAGGSNVSGDYSNAHHYFSGAFTVYVANQFVAGPNFMGSYLRFATFGNSTYSTWAVSYRDMARLQGF